MDGAVAFPPAVPMRIGDSLLKWTLDRKLRKKHGPWYLERAPRISREGKVCCSKELISMYTPDGGECQRGTIRKAGSDGASGARV
jgi:hypothetical protein